MRAMVVELHVFLTLALDGLSSQLHYLATFISGKRSPLSAEAGWAVLHTTGVEQVLYGGEFVDWARSRYRCA